MRRRCVFKCQIYGKWYYVYEYPHPKSRGLTYYKTYVGRKRLDVCTWSYLGSAIGSILKELEGGVLIDLVEVWK